MGFLVSVTGHIDQAEHNVEQVEKRLVAKMREVVAEFAPHVQSATVLGTTVSADVASPAPEAPEVAPVDPPSTAPPVEPLAAPVQEVPAETPAVEPEAPPQP